MKKLLLIPLLILGVSINAGTREETIADRINKVGEVCLEGSECASAPSAMTIAAADGGGGAKANYDKTCATCHNAGVAGAPKLGVAADWETRIAKGMDVLYNSSINGMPPAMPAKGMCFTCSDDDLKAIVDYMIETTK